MAPPSHVTVLGAGLTGLTTAYRLSTRLPSTKITLIDSASRTGGWINSQSHHLTLSDDAGPSSSSSSLASSSLPEKTTRSGDVVIESGPRSIRPRGSPGAAGMLKLILDLGLKDDIIAIPKTHPSAKNRYILSKDNKLRPLSLNLFHSALKPSTLLSASLEPLRSRRKEGPEADESVDSFLRRRFGPGVAELASAGLHGIYAASSGDLSARAVLGRLYDWETEYGSVIGGLMRNGRSAKAKREKTDEAARWEGLGEMGREREAWAMYGLRGGLGTLTDGLTRAIRNQKVDLRLDTLVKDLTVTPKGVDLTLDSETISTSHVISSLAPANLAPLVSDIAFPISPRTSVGVVSLVFPVPPSQIHPDGFGYLIPRPSDLSNNPSGILGVVFDSTALPGLDSIQGVTKLTIMMGGPYWCSYHPTIPRPASGDDLVPLALEHVRTVFPSIRDIEPALVLSSLHKDCIPTYTTGHTARTRSLHQEIVDSPWHGKLSLVGNAFAGVGVNDCVWSAEQMVEALADGRPATGLEAWATSTPEQIP